MSTRLRVRQGIERNLGFPISDVAWDLLLQLPGYVARNWSEEAIEKESIADCVGVFRAFESCSENGEAVRDRQRMLARESVRPNHDKNSAHSRTAWARARMVAFDASQTEPVKKIRRLYGVGNLGPQEAKDFICSPAVRVLNATMLDELGIPTISGEIAIEHLTDQAREEKMSAISTEWSRQPNGTESLRLRIQPVGTVIECRRLPPHASSIWGDKRVPMPVFPESGRPMPFHDPSVLDGEAVWAYSGSALWQIAEVSDWLSIRYRWSTNEALWFLLTSETPSLPPISVEIECMRGVEGVSDPMSGSDSSIRSSVTVSLKIDAWVLPSEVEGVYRRARSRYMREGERQRPHAAEVVEFLLDESQFTEGNWTYQSLADKWNELHPDRVPWTRQRAATEVRRAKESIQSLRSPYDNDMVGVYTHGWPDPDLDPETITCCQFVIE